jgi:hypothetical protein
MTALQEMEWRRGAATLPGTVARQAPPKIGTCFPGDIPCGTAGPLRPSETEIAGEPVCDP